MKERQSATSCRAALRRATSRAAPEISVAMTRAAGNSCASAMAIRPGAGAHASARRNSSLRRGEADSDPTPRRSKCHFDDVLGFRARNQHIRRDLELQAPKFLTAGEVLRRDATRAPGNK